MKKTIVAKKPLVLETQTVRVLTDRQLQRAVGGIRKAGGSGYTNGAACLPQDGQ